MPTDISASNLQNQFSNAYEWLCRSRKKHPPSSDIWSFCRGWKQQAHRMKERFIQGRYRFAVQQRITLAQGDTVALWSSCDALVLKVLTCIIQKLLKLFLSKNCYHIKGNVGTYRPHGVFGVFIVNIVKSGVSNCHVHPLGGALLCIRTPCTRPVVGGLHIHKRVTGRQSRVRLSNIN